MVKHCRRCGTDRPLSEWPKDRGAKDGLAYVCSPCNRERASRWQAENAERARTRKAEWERANRDKVAASQRRRRLMSPDAVAAIKDRWRIKNLDRMAAHSAAYRSRRAQATPGWLAENDMNDMVAIFAMSERISRCTGIRHEVDHIVPLKGESVCGLHVPWNLAPVPARFNRSKGNRLKEYHQ